MIIGCDPGAERSAIVGWDPTTATIVMHEEDDNERMLDRFRARGNDGSVLVIEAVESFGMAVGVTVFETVFTSGRFAEAWFPKPVQRLPRRAVKLHICHQSRATDSNIRQALIDRFGPSTEKAIGSKKSPGPLYRITGHKLAALAVALTWADQHNSEPAGPIIRPGVVAEF